MATKKKVTKAPKKKVTKKKVLKKKVLKKKVQVRVESVVHNEKESLSREQRAEAHSHMVDSIADSKKKASHERLTKKQQAFADEYLKDFNGSKAAKKAGYKAKNSRFTAHENLTKPNIRSYISRKMEKRAERTEITQDMIVNELATIAFSDMRDFTHWDKEGVRLKNSDDMGDEVAALQELTTAQTEFGNNTKIKLYSKLTALELLGRHLSLELAKSKHDHTHKGNIQLSIEQMSDDELLAVIDDDEDDDDGTGEETT